MANRVSVIIDVATKSAQSALQKLRTDVGQAEGAVGKFKAGSTAAFDAVKANAGAMALAAGAALVSFGVKAVGAFQDLALEAGKTSEATGIAVEDVSRLIEVAGDLGIEAGTVESAIMRMNKSLADGKAPTKELTDEIVRGADGNIDSYESFINLATAIGKIKDPTLRAKAAQETFGRSYGEIAELMALSADELRVKLGEVSDAKVIDEDEVRKARELREALDKLKDAGEDVALLLGETLVPVVTDLAEGAGVLSDALGNVGLGKGGFLDDVIEASSGLLGLAGKLFGADEAAEDMGYSIGIAGEKARRAEGDTEALADETERLDSAARNASAAWDALSQALDNEQAANSLADAFARITEEGAASASQVTSLKQEVVSYAQQVGGIPVTKVTEINALIDEGAFAEAERQIALLVRRREFPITPRVISGSGTTSKFATGTSATGPRPYIAGEDGPELIVPGGSGDQVFSAGQTSRMLAGASGGGGQPLVVQFVMNDRVVQEMLVSANRLQGGAR